MEKSVYVVVLGLSILSSLGGLYFWVRSSWKNQIERVAKKLVASQSERGGTGQNLRTDLWAQVFNARSGTSLKGIDVRAVANFLLLPGLYASIASLVSLPTKVSHGDLAGGCGKGDDSVQKECVRVVNESILPLTTELACSVALAGFFLFSIFFLFVNFLTYRSRSVFMEVRAYCLLTSG